MKGLVYDAGALVSAEHDGRAIWAIHRRALAHGVKPKVPVGVLAQAWRGGPQAHLSRLLVACDIEPLLEDDARRLGALAKQSGHSDTVDLAVADLALRTGFPVVTSDSGDIQRIVDSAGVSVRIHEI